MQEQVADAAKVQGWIDQLTPEQEITCDYWPRTEYGDPEGPIWALMSLDARTVIDFIDRDVSAFDSFGEIGDMLDAEAAAGRIAQVACGYYRHPLRAAADQRQAEERDRLRDARAPVDDAVDGIMGQLADLGERLHAIDPSLTVAQHRAALARTVTRYMDAWPDPAEMTGPPTLDVDEDDVPF